MAIASIFTWGFLSFWMKVISQRNYNSSFIAIIMYLSSAFFAWGYYLFRYWDNLLASSLTLLLIFAFCHSLFYFSSILSRVKSLDNIDTIIFFPLYKTFHPIIITVISFFIFQESLTAKEMLGIIVWIMVPLLLITKVENTKQKNLKKGIIFVIITSILASIAAIFPKMANLYSLNIELYILASGIFGALSAFTNYTIFHSKEKHKYSTKWIYSTGIFIWFLQFTWLYTFTHSLAWNMAVAVTVNSFSILIPIILSVVFYKEEMTYKKAFVIFLSIVSVILFI